MVGFLSLSAATYAQSERRREIMPFEMRYAKNTAWHYGVIAGETLFTLSQ